MRVQRERTITTTGKIITKIDGRCKMKLSKSMFYYFGFWILYIPFSIVLTLLLNYNLEQFFVSFGLGALMLLVFLTVRLVFYKVRMKGIPLPSDTKVGEAPLPEEKLEGFRTMFTEVSNETKEITA